MTITLIIGTFWLFNLLFFLKHFWRLYYILYEWRILFIAMYLLTGPLWQLLRVGKRDHRAPWSHPSLETKPWHLLDPSLVCIPSENFKTFKDVEIYLYKVVMCVCQFALRIRERDLKSAPEPYHIVGNYEKII